MSATTPVGNSPATTVRRYLAGLLVNLLIGIPMVVVVVCWRWYLDHGHCDLDDLQRSDLDGCTYDQIESSDFALFGLVMSAALVVLLILRFDVLKPLARERSLKPRLLTLPAVLLPYVLLLAAARNG
ncbi:hypothetical protein [Streptomyces aurantiogriseus]|uniref:Uncharacterized protein n=1 Tax=Streptomyces aurantiogriseus TaxID=66870 RepID=A0A918BUY6_9ACTN|nr:hypothetical protein [Streptomyces aurantiogriseus]GGQ91680.1 hypothetical protein GCM10010251_02750 [Streptomyces aurantiogriseus]